MESLPLLVLLNETFLDAGSGVPVLCGYNCIARRGRTSGWGGVAVFAKDSHADLFTHLRTSASAERSWFLAHTNLGPLLLGCWCRAPAPGDLSAVRSLDSERRELSNDTIGTLLIGDVN
eukprot:8004531-Alexandrium_andersonii.AAC.1